MTELQIMSALSSQDIKLMKKFGFASAWIQRAKSLGVFQTENIEVIWSMAWTKRSDFFYEIARNAFPIGNDIKGNLIYVTDITSASSKMGLLDTQSMKYATISSSFDEFIQNLPRIFPFDFIESNQDFQSLGQSVQFNICRCEVGEVVNFLPFGSNTRGKITHRSGEYRAVFETSESSSKFETMRNFIWYVGLFLASILYFTCMNVFGVKFSIQLIFYIIFIFSLAPFHMLWSKMSGNWHRF